MIKNKNRSGELPALALTFVNVLGLTIFMPVLPFIVEDFGAPTWVYGLLLASYPAAMFFGSPILGELSDRIGRKPVLLFSQAGTLLSWIIFACSYFVAQISDISAVWPIAILLIARITDGLTGGNISVVNAYLADITPEKELTKVFSKIGAITGFAVIAGPAIGSFSSSTRIGYLGLALVAILISSVTLYLIWRYLQESLQKPARIKRSQSRLSQINIVSRLRHLHTRKGGKYMLALNAGFGLVMAGYSSIIVLFLIDNFSLTQTQVGTFMLIVGVTLIFNQYVIVPPVASKLGDLKTFLLGMVFTSAGLLLITLTNNFWLFVALYYSLNLGLSLVLPTGKSLVAKSVRHEKQGEVQGIDESLRSASRAIMPLIMGAIYGVYAYKSFYILSVLAIFVVLAFVFFGTNRIQLRPKLLTKKDKDIDYL